MAIRSFRLIEPTMPGLHYTAIVETDGDYEPMDDTAFSEDRRLYSLQYRSVPGADPRIDAWDMDIIFTNRGSRQIAYEILDETHRDIHGHEEQPPVKDGM